MTTIDIIFNYLGTPSNDFIIDNFQQQLFTCFLSDKTSQNYEIKLSKALSTIRHILESLQSVHSLVPLKYVYSIYDNLQKYIL